MTDLVASQAETDRLIQENARMLRELDVPGGFTTGMAFPSMQRLLIEELGMNVVSVRAIGHRKDRRLEIDVLAYSETRVFAVEVKSHLREDGLQQMLRILREFHEFFPGHEGKSIYGILAAVDAPEDIRERVLREGIYVAMVHDDNFEIRVPAGFQPRAF